jgi:hypothetical protein
MLTAMVPASAHPARGRVGLAARRHTVRKDDRDRRFAVGNAKAKAELGWTLQAPPTGTDSGSASW